MRAKRNGLSDRVGQALKSNVRKQLTLWDTLRHWTAEKPKTRDARFGHIMLFLYFRLLLLVLQARVDFPDQRPSAAKISADIRPQLIKSLKYLIINNFDIYEILINQPIRTNLEFSRAQFVEKRAYSSRTI
jgi:hypothetical protein